MGKLWKRGKFRKGKVNKTYGSVPKKTGTKIYGRDELDTTIPIVGKQHITLL